MITWTISIYLHIFFSGMGPEDTMVGLLVYDNYGCVLLFLFSHRCQHACAYFLSTFHIFCFFFVFNLVDDEGEK